ncbi:MAG: DNRLRE domain-containing protein [Bacteroidales bacterium]|nr:DNRLRE domain-containing protein [Bacteroidales bacterium]
MWDQNEVDWYNQPSVSNQNRVYLATSLTTDQSYPDIDVTSLIKDMYNDPLNSHGLRLSLVDEYVYRSMILASSDHPDEMIRPSLVIRYDTCTLPVDSFSYFIDDNFCQFSYSDSSVTSWRWDFGNGYGADLQNPSYHFIEAGVYNVCVTVENECGSLLICDSIIACEALEPDFNFIIDGLNVLFTNLTLGENTYYWDFGNDYFSYVENPEFQFLETGEYQVCLSATNDCKTSLICKTVELSKASGINPSISESLIKFYPNPAIEEVFIQSDGLVIYEIILYDCQGLCRERINTDSMLDEYRLPLPTEGPGLYFLNLITDQGTFTKKLFIL